MNKNKLMYQYIFPLIILLLVIFASWFIVIKRALLNNKMGFIMRSSIIYTIVTFIYLFTFTNIPKKIRFSKKQNVKYIQYLNIFISVYAINWILSVVSNAILHKILIKRNIIENNKHQEKLYIINFILLLGVIIFLKLINFPSMAPL